MVTLVHGLPGSGKSAYYEREIEQHHEASIIYFATLLETAANAEFINRHIMRRSKRWQVIVTSGDIEDDRVALLQLVNGISTCKIILIDSLMNWCESCANQKWDYLNIANHLANVIVNIINAHHCIEWYILDYSQICFKQIPTLFEVWNVLYQTIISQVKGINCVDWGGDKR